MLKRVHSSLCFLVLFFSATQFGLAEEVLVVTWRGITEAEQGFQSKLKKLRPGVKFRHIDAGRDRKQLETLIKSENLSGIDLVYSFGTTGSAIVKKHLKGSIPQLFNIVTAPESSGIVRSLDKPGENISGAKLGVDIDIQLNFLMTLKKIKKLGVWYDPRESQGMIVLRRIWAFAKKHNIEIIPTRLIPDAEKKQFENMIDKAMAEAEKLDAVYLVPISSFATIRNKYFPRFAPEILVMSGVNATVGNGATIALAPNYRERGESVAEIAHKVLSGTNAGNIPVNLLTLNTASLYIDRKRAKAAGIKKLKSTGLRVIER